MSVERVSTPTHKDGDPTQSCGTDGCSREEDKVKSNKRDGTVRYGTQLQRILETRHPDLR